MDEVLRDNFAPFITLLLSFAADSARANDAGLISISGAIANDEFEGDADEEGRRWSQWVSVKSPGL